MYTEYLLSLELDGIFQITIQRTELNSPLGLEVQLHITEAVCPALSEPGLFKSIDLLWLKLQKHRVLLFNFLKHKITLTFINDGALRVTSSSPFLYWIVCLSKSRRCEPKFSAGNIYFSIPPLATFVMTLYN